MTGEISVEGSAIGFKSSCPPLGILISLVSLVGLMISIILTLICLVGLVSLTLISIRTMLEISVTLGALICLVGFVSLMSISIMLGSIFLVIHCLALDPT